MERRRNRYKQMQRNMLRILIADLCFFVIYLFAAGFGVIWLKATVAIIAILISGLCLGFLYLTQEITKPRSLWMTATALAVLICIVFSLILRYPSPNPYKTDNYSASTVQVDDTTPT